MAPHWYVYISDCNNYEKAEEVLRSLYVQPKNEIFVRHLLATHRQNSGESLDQFLQALKFLAMDCQIKSVTAVIIMLGMPSYVNGMASGAICQYLLENMNLSTAYE